MVRNLIKWRNLRWALSIPALPIALWACTSHPLTKPAPQPEQGTNITINVAPSRELDLIFLIDNSKSMEPKQAKLKAQFPLLINALKDPTNNPQLPDLRIAIVNSDVGTGASGLCTPRYGDQGKFQVPNAATCGLNAGATFLDYKNGRNVNFAANRDIAEVFGCLAVGVGQTGCGLEQQLQALYFSMFVADPVTKKTQAQDFIRPDAFLGLVVLSDEDDCSTPLDSLVAQDNIDTESYSLRCATRGHQCAGSNLAYPTTGPYRNDFFACGARQDTCPVGENGAKPTNCSPLESVEGLANKIKRIKTVVADGKEITDLDKFLVAGIFGWPRTGQSNPEYKIDKAPNSGGNDFADQWDYFPVCYDPNHPLPANLADKDKVRDAFGWGAFGGLRIKAFLDQFPKESTLPFSICEPDFKESMTKIGEALAAKLTNLCIPKKLLDTVPEPKGVPVVVQADCRVFDRVPTADSQGRLTYKEYEDMPHCDVAGTIRPCWRVEANLQKCPVKKDAAGTVIPSQLIVVERGGKQVETNTRVVMQCRTCAELTELTKDIYQVDGCKY